MTRIDLRLGGKPKEPLQGSVQSLCTAPKLIVFGILKSEIDAAHVPYEQRVAGEHEPVVDEETNVLGCVAGGVDHTDTTVSDLDDIPVR
jgi:hypothetical protein